MFIAFFFGKSLTYTLTIDTMCCINLFKRLEDELEKLFLFRPLREKTLFFLVRLFPMVQTGDG